MKISNLKRLIKNIFIKNGLSNKHSKTCADALINAELVGAPSHGVVIHRRQRKHRARREMMLIFHNMGKVSVRFPAFVWQMHHLKTLTL